MIRSMTAFASRQGAHGAVAWDWDLRSVNGRGLDLRLRLPEGIEGLEAAARAALAARLSRGGVTLNLRLSREVGEAGFALDEGRLDRVLAAFELVQSRAFAMGVTLAQPTAADVLSQRGVIVPSLPDADDDGLLAALTADLGALLDGFVAAREAEGRALGAVLGAQVDAIEALTEAAAGAADARREEARAALRAALARVLAEAEVDEARLAQELALLAVRADVTEEVDRLRAHVAAARDLIASPSPAGRRLDFLTQELNREANTLLSKAGSTALSRIGLDLKAVIDQLREQVQNVE